MRRSFTIRDLPVSERPRERFVRLGPEALSTPELLALILTSGGKGKSVMAISQELLVNFGNLKNLADASIEEIIKKTKGIGEAKAIQLKAVFELAKRLEEPEKERPEIKTPEDAFQIARRELKGKKKEHFLALLLDTRNRLIRTSKVSIGSLDAAIAHPREVYQDAVKASAAGVIFTHNHPSGDPEPSDEDIKLTKRLKEAGMLMEVPLLDHIIVTDSKFYSMKSRNLL